MAWFWRSFLLESRSKSSHLGHRVTALLLFHWVSFALAKQGVLFFTPSSAHQFFVLYPSIDYGQFFTWYQVWALLDSGASYPFGPFVKTFHHSEWCTAFYVVLSSCFTSSSSVHKTPWNYPKTDVNCRHYSVNKRSSEPCLADCQTVFSQQTPESCSHILSAMAFHMAILTWMLI